MSLEKNDEAVRDMVREGYAGIARNSGQCCGGATTNADTIARHIGYSEEDVRAVPTGSNLGLGCGNLLPLANVQPGETVLDLGSGAGFDALLAARVVGLLGHAPEGCRAQVGPSAHCRFLDDRPRHLACAAKEIWIAALLWKAMQQV
jgi:hypothetical protein